MLLTVNTSCCFKPSNIILLSEQTTSWGQDWRPSRGRGGSFEGRYSPPSNHPRQGPSPDMEERPPPVPPKDHRRSSQSSTSRRRVPAPLRSSDYQRQPNQQSSNRQSGQTTSTYTSYTYPPSNYASTSPTEPSSAPSTTTEFAEVDATIAAWQRSSELFIPGEGVTPRAATFASTAGPSSEHHPPSSSGTLRRTVSSYSAADYSPSVYSPSPSPQSVSAISRSETFRSQSTWVPSPMSPELPRLPREHWATNSYPPPQPDNRRGSAWSPTEEPFDDASQFHLFVEATSGLGPLDNNGNNNGSSHTRGSVFSPQGNRGDGNGGNNDRYLHYQHQYGTAPRATSVPPQVPQEFYAPRPAGHSGVHRRQTYQHRPREAQESTHAFAAALAGVVMDQEPSDDDDELPDYAQSQREAQARQRRAAAQRAQELEERWARAKAAAGRHQ
ncbi:hypothetical protein NA57DRAFT_53694 [Rhizodiscina lignyota]|uniref:Uncharacterized protein n=1 Tax=Rhizodiscina lignyota TaxID=1504668 RepID=A0A9P4IM39_9PEZI|nr:hypothetical protein NA57DRAFT_53694 [Rhizodiscina lignyota]